MLLLMLVLFVHFPHIVILWVFQQKNAWLQQTTTRRPGWLDPLQRSSVNPQLSLTWQYYLYQVCFACQHQSQCRS